LITSFGAAKMGAASSKDNAEAEAIRLRAVADIEVLKQKSADESKRTSAETEALKQKSADESKKSAAETEVLKQRASAETEAFKQSNDWQYRKEIAQIVLAVFGIGVLVVDYAVHDHKGVILWRMKRHLRGLTSRLPPTVTAPPSVLLPVPSAALKLVPGTPTMVLAPTGAGKSTLLKEYARWSAPLSPTVLVHFRLPPNDGKDAAHPQPDADGGMGSIAASVFRQIGFPMRQSLVGFLLRQPWRTSVGEVRPMLPSASRLNLAFHLLFQACADIFSERLYGTAIEKAACVLLFDEVQDLVKNGRLAEAGGREVFQQLARLLATEAVDNKRVLAAVAGSSAQLDMEFESTVMSGNRWLSHELQDPTAATVKARLVERGFDQATAQRLIDRLGTRLRLMHYPLAQVDAPAQWDAEQYIASVMRRAQASYAALFQDIQGQDAKVMAQLLDDLANGKVITYAQLPQTVKTKGTYGKALYMLLDRTLQFQSRAHELVWRDTAMRAQLTQGVLPMQ
jgi:hypothetical protein